MISLPEALKNEARNELVHVAQLIVGRKMNIVEGSRLIVNLANKAEIIKDEIFLNIIGFESQTDHFQIGGSRKQYDEKYLQDLDKEQEEYEREFNKDIINSCKAILKKYSVKTKDN